MSKKITLLFLIIVLLGIGLGVYYKVFYKKPVIKESSNNIIKDEAPPFLSAFPNGLINQKNIIKTIDSFRVDVLNNKHQYTYKYITNLSVVENNKYFNDFFVKNNFAQLSVDTAPDLSYFTISARNKTDFVVVLVNRLKDSTGSVVDITIIK
jgi:hypothetical protein